ncbi:site-specific integrase [Novosphingobium sp. PY1]|uniref:Tyr recombinase domain-containing protein n=1 Tax=Ochrobactrum sp. PW1 TaxID=1882222 RepID=A0A292GSC3_9HYPH|nr:site-specific integrase [Novosphingobium sp. PY1]BBA74376.1 hypothetical protein [Ochrobactrum sp. PW1]GFM29225.1 uncharacterized protein PY1_contig-07-151 [Novosphingobium sp. PY1]
MPRLPKLEHVKYVKSKGKVYAYFNTGAKKDGRTIYARLPHPSDTGFYESYAGMCRARKRRGGTAYTVAQLVADYETAMERRIDLAEGSKTLYRKINKKVVTFLGDFPVNDLQPDDVQFVLDEKINGVGAYNSFLSMISILYKHARKAGKTKLEPTKDMAKLKTGEHEPWPEPILQAGLSAKDDQLRLAISLLYYTGQRISDVVKMRWSDIADGEIFVLQKKTSKDVCPPLHSALAAELARTPKRGMTILCDEIGKPMEDRVIRAQIKAFTKKLGKECIPHGLRKNAVIALLEAGCTVAEVSAITGQTFQVVEKYANRVNRRRLGRAAILKLENSSGTGKPS